MKYSIILKSFAILLLLAASGFSPEKGGPAPSGVPLPDVLIVHDSLPGPIPSGVVDGNTIMDLMGHFGLKGTIVSLEQYKAGEIAKHRFVFILGIDDRQTTYPAHLLTDVRTSKVPVFWIFKHLDELLSDSAFAEKLGILAPRGTPLEGFNSVVYKNTTLLKNEPQLFQIQVRDASKVQIFATSRDDRGQAQPYALRSGNFWYIADSPLAYSSEGDRYWVFCDLLHDFFNIPHIEARKALLRLEDVSQEEEPQTLRDLADYLFERNIPFQISLIPIYKDPAKNEEIYLSDRPQFAAAIRYMVSKGGLVVMHGTTHQYRGKSGDDFEFWDDAAGKPIQTDSRQLVENKLRNGLEECFRNGIYPVTWETPHYMASQLDYRVFASIFNSSYERVASIDNGESGHFFPYPSVDRFGRFIIPESLGYISLKDPDTDLLVKNSERLKVIRDGVASFFFHTFMDLKYLTACLDGIEANGYKFFSIRDYDLRVQLDDRLVQTYTDPVQLRLDGRYLHRFLLNAAGQRTAESFSPKILNTAITDPGIVPDDSILVMEGKLEIAELKEPPPPTWWEGFRSWVRGYFRSKQEVGSLSGQPQVMVLWEDNLPQGDWNDQQSYVSAFSASGFRVSKSNWKDFSKSLLDPDTVLIVPRGVALKLSNRQIESIVDWTKEGGRLIVETWTNLSAALGVHDEKRTLRVKSIDELLYGSTPEWNPEWKRPVNVERCTVPNTISIYARDSQSEMPMVVLARLGRGRFIYSGVRLDPLTTLGYARFPYFVQYVSEGFALKFPARRAQVELYFDPSYSKKAIESEVDRWRQLGVRGIYASANQFWPQWSYNYQHLIDVCHRNGILVYAWLELPHVSVKFWEDHPQWRAKTATGADGQVGWRYNMDLDIPECREAVFAFVEDLLRKHAWDGVNLAELNFDTENGPENPAKYLPMGSSTREAFRALNGFDPRLLFTRDSPFFWKTNPAALSKFEAYRIQRVTEWHRAVLEKLGPIAQERDMEIIVTMFDSLHSKTLTRDTGVDSKRIVSLMDQYPFTLQVEDPSHLWADSPDRYHRFTETYLRIVRDRRRLMFDINVVPRDIEHSLSSTELLVGTELAHSLIGASEASGRAAIYSANSLSFQDLVMLSRILAHNTRIDRVWNGWQTTSDRSILLTAPGQWLKFHVDGHVWPGWGENEVFIPGGTHRITPYEPGFRLVDTSLLDLHLLRFTGNLDSLAPTNRGLEFTYDSDLRTLALFNRAPHELRVDGKLLEESAVSNFGSWSVRLPRGKHRVEVVADSAAYVLLDRTSLYSSHFIVIFGGVACALMALLYMSILARRVFARAVHGKRAPTAPPTHRF